MADPSDHDSLESEPEMMTSGELKLHYRDRLRHLAALSSRSQADVALTTQADLEIGKDIVLVLKHAKDTRKRDFEKFSRAMTTHRYAVARKMEDLREKKAAHTAGIAGSAIDLEWGFEEVLEAVRTQRDMERAACKMLALTGVTDSHMTVLDTVCEKIANSLDLAHSETYCEEVLEVLGPHEDESILPDEIVEMSPSPFKGLEIVQGNIDHMYALKRVKAHAWTFALPKAWNHLWELSVAYREGGASEDEIKILWYMTMRRRLPPSTVEGLRKLLEDQNESAKAMETPVEGTAHQGGSGTTTGEQSQDRKTATDTIREAINFSQSTRVGAPKKRTRKQGRQLSKHAYLLLSHGRKPERRSVRQKGRFEKFLESFYDRLDGREVAESQTDVNALAARINGDNTAKGKRNKTSTNIDDPVDASERASRRSKSMAQSAPIADDYLDFYYETFEKGTQRVHSENRVIEMAEAANHKLHDIWGWQPTHNDVTLLETKLTAKITECRC